ncbi:MAG: glycoside hydrolase family 31 protein [Flammeovirgaceae bacterium]
MSNAHPISPETIPGKAIKHTANGNSFHFHCDNRTALYVHVITDEIIRFRYTPDGVFQDDFSYAIVEDLKEHVSKLKFTQSYNFYDIKTAKLNCRIFKEGLRVQISDKKGNVLNEDAAKGFHWEENKLHGGYVVQMSKKIQIHENFYGLGDKSTRLNLRGKRLQNWSTDAFGFGPHTDPLYKNIPFFYGSHDNGHYGLFFDNSFRSFFDFGHEKGDLCSFWAHGGEMNYYFIYGHTLTNVGENYTYLTGKPELPPLWALGFHQCKWSYYPESEVRELAAKFRDLEIPCDCIYLDIDYMDDYECFTWDKKKFPNPPKMIDDLKKDGFKTIVMIDPGIKIDENYFVYQQGIKGDYFVKRQDGDLLKGEVWPGQCHFPDYTNPKVREWWATLYKEMIRKDGVAGFWNDMNEPAVFDRDEKTIYDDARHNYDGHPCSHRKAHNIYGMQMARASYKGIKEYIYPKRPFLITRAIYAGTQRYALGWTGDNQATWEHLKIANTQCQRLSISGMSFIGTDIGGFDGVPTGELFTRWIQLGIFHPFFRVHSMGDNLSGAMPIDHAAVEANKRSGKITDQEPWSFGDEYTPVIKKFIEMRYQLLPYIYTAFWQYATVGTPMIRSLAFLDSDDKQTFYREEEFAFGENLLVCPMTLPGQDKRLMYLPEGEWFNYWSDELVEGKEEIEVDAPIDVIPIFVRPGAVLPFAPSMQYVGEKVIEQLTLHVYYIEGEHVSTLYEDEGEGYGYQEGDYQLKNFTVTGNSKWVRLSQKCKGNFKVSYRTYKVILHGIPFHTKTITVDEDDPIKIKNNIFEVSADFKDILIE